MAKREKRRAGERLYHYTYLITDHINNKYYYGVHSTDFDPEDIRQYHSSSKHLTIMIKSLGIENFTKSVRRYFKSRPEADAWEHKVLRRMKVRTNNKFYNQSEGGIGFVATGHTSVKEVGTGKRLRVPVDDPYIGILYHHNTCGQSRTDEAKAHLSSLYKGVKWVGEDNPVHYLKDDPNWIRKISESTSGRRLSEQQIISMREPERYSHLDSSTTSKAVRERMNFIRTINNNKNTSIYMYKGELYMSIQELPVYYGNSAVVTLHEPHPLVATLVADGIGYVDMKSAAIYLGVNGNTIKRRLRKNTPFWSNYYYLDNDVILKAKEEAMVEFRRSMGDKYSRLSLEQIQYVKPLSKGMDDHKATEIFMATGKFLVGCTFKRSSIVDVNGWYSWYESTCPLCSNDYYVDQGLCSGIFLSRYNTLKQGGVPCRCNYKRKWDVNLYIHHIQQLLVSEDCFFVELGAIANKRETFFTWQCRADNIHKTNIGLFLEKGKRCACCNDFYKDNPPVSMVLKDEFKLRRLAYENNQQCGNDE